MVSYPDLRLRRVREHEPLRRMVRETTLSPSNLIYPMFVTHGQGLRQ
ncbi:MAG: porphobilinogen synthase, partial [Chloroflexi bacterium]|nr:porphobilinogen synthase [Chloroflexota bacterium]